jgi:hypothetical protein
MGLLDDAIREHLELKRSHGADPDEVARQEHEALGETRRAEFARPEGAEQADAPVGAEPEAAAATEPPEDFPVPEFHAGREDAPEPDALEPSDDAPEDLGAPDEVAEADDLAAPTAELEAAHEPFDVEAEAPPAAAPEPAAPAERDDPWLDEERDEVPADEALDHPRESGGDEDEDVLEETPEFLQETPEHDRLWFEQRPPRDFDWDK